jgi:hypothetical protein
VVRVVQVVAAVQVEVEVEVGLVDAVRGVFTQRYRGVFTMKVYRPILNFQMVEPVERGRQVVRVEVGVL